MIEPYQSSRGYVESHVLVLTPVIASLLAKAGYSKHDVAEYIKKNAMVPARYYEWSMMLGDHHTPGTTLAGLVEEGELPKEWHLSDDPDRLVPLLLPRERVADRRRRRSAAKPLVHLPAELQAGLCDEQAGGGAEELGGPGCGE